MTAGCFLQLLTTKGTPGVVGVYSVEEADGKLAP